MELQTNSQQKTSRLKVSTVFLGLVIVLIPIVIGIFINMPQVMEWVKISWKEISKGGLIGFSVLPVMLFVTIKGGNYWYKKWWAWGLLGVAIVAVIGISFFSSSGIGAEAMKEMGMPGEVPFY